MPFHRDPSTESGPDNAGVACGAAPGQEIEAAKEELQSINAELANVNTELEGRLDELKVANDDLTNLLASADIAILLLDAEGRIKRFTPASQRLFHLDPTDVGRPLSDFDDRFLDGDLDRDIHRVMAGESKIETEVATIDGRWYTQRLRPYLASAGHIAGVVATFIDVTARKAGEVRDRRLAALMRDSNDAVIVLDVDGTIRDWGRGAERHYGWPKLEVLGSSILKIVPEDRHEETRELLATLAHGARVESVETQRVTRDGRLLDVWLTATALGDVGGDGMAIATTERDVTHRERELETARVTAERLSAQKTLFMASANHDLRQPLQTLRLLNATLASRLDDDESALELLAQQSRNLETMQALLDTLLDVTRLELGQVTPQLNVFSAGELCRTLADHFDIQTRAKGLRLRVVPCDHLIRSDRQLLRSILQNLVSNAITHTERGSVLVGCRRRGGSLRFEVWDSGPGIPESELEMIFEDFHQLENTARERGKGTGLGLPLTRRIADLLGYPLEVRSMPGRGSMFSVTVPMASATESELETEPKPATPLPSAEVAATILLVEDDPDVAAALGMLWDVAGFDHVAIGRGSEALEQVDGRGVVPDIVICDYRLPGGMNGLEVVEAIRERLGRSIPAVLLTGDTMSVASEDVAERGCTLVYKPADPAALLRLINDLLGIDGAAH